MNRFLTYTGSITSVCAAGATVQNIGNIVSPNRDFFVKSLLIDYIYQTGIAIQIIPYEQNNSQDIIINLVGAQTNALALLNLTVAVGSLFATANAPAIRRPGQYFFEGLKYTNNCQVVLQHTNNDLVNAYVCYCNYLIEISYDN